MKKILTQKNFVAGVAAFAIVAVAAPGVHAAVTRDSQLTQVINPGVISTDIVDATGVSVSTASAVFGMSPVSVSTAVQTTTGLFGDNSRRISVDNPGDATNGWTLDLAGTTPAEVWQGVTPANTYEFNGAAAADGQLTVDPSAGSLNVNVGTTTGITQGTAATFDTGANSNIVLMQGAAGSDDVWNGYMTDIGLSQTIPSGQAADTYTLDLTQTVTKN